MSHLRKVHRGGTTVAAWLRRPNQGLQLPFRGCFASEPFCDCVSRSLQLHWWQTQRPRPSVHLYSQECQHRCWSLYFILCYRNAKLQARIYGHPEGLRTLCLLGWPKNKKIIQVMEWSAHASASATAKKIFGADLSPNGRAVSMYTSESHLMPSRAWSSGCTGTILYAFFRSILASSVPVPSSRIVAVASCRDVYCSELSLGWIVSLTLASGGADRSTISLRSPGCLDFGMRPMGLTCTVLTKGAGMGPRSQNARSSSWTCWDTRWGLELTDCALRPDDLSRPASWLAPIWKPCVMPVRMYWAKLWSGWLPKYFAHFSALYGVAS